MSLASIRSICFTTLLLSFATVTTSRHIHRHLVHHHARDATPSTTTKDVPTPTLDVASSSITAGDDAIEDIQQIQQGLSDLPGDLLEFIQAIEARLEEVEGMLSNLVGSSASTSTGSSTSPSKTRPGTYVDATFLANASTVSPIFPATSQTEVPTAAASTLPGIIPVVAPYFTTFRTSRVTSTRVRTVTLQPSISARPAILTNGTGNYTQPYATTARPVMLTRTVQPLPHGVTITSTITTSS